MRHSPRDSGNWLGPAVNGAGSEQQTQSPHQTAAGPLADGRGTQSDLRYFRSADFRGAILPAATGKVNTALDLKRRQRN
jgi:hypothetical protein